MSAEEQASVPPVEHPLARRLADGRRALYLGSHASHVVGMPPEQGRALLHELLEHVTASPGLYRHCWRAGDLLIWDNRVTQHRRTPYRYHSDRRVLRRTTVCGTERPRGRSLRHRGLLASVPGLPPGRRFGGYPRSRAWG